MPKGLLLTNFYNCAPAEFPMGFDYRVRFRHLANSLNNQVHPSVTPGANVAGQNFLTDHGPDHISAVIRRASDLLETAESDFLTCYEKYLLLAAIHVHDVGNMYGRQDHELLAEQVMKRLGPLFGPDEVEKRAIFKIAQAHGGQQDGSKDKISDLQQEEYILNQRVHPRVLAALLRFADELADDRSRASRFLMEEGKIPESSLIYHKYAYALQSVSVANDSVNLNFALAPDDATLTIKKDKKPIYLLDEIYRRTIKMHCERIYCMRFLRPNIDIDRIDVTIQVFGHGYSEELANFSYRLVEVGYPTEDNPIFVLCRGLQDHEYGAPLNGSNLKFYIKRKLRQE
jgi:hypothetical protein